MKTLNESLIEEYEIITEEFDFSVGDQNVDPNKLKRIYNVLLKHKDDSKDFERSARTVVNIVLSNEFNT